MESLETISKLEISVNKIRYNKKSKLLSVDIISFAFVGHYKRSTKIGELLDDIYASLREPKFERNNICFLDNNNEAFPETKKIKNFMLINKK